MIPKSQASKGFNFGRSAASNRAHIAQPRQVVTGCPDYRLTQPTAGISIRPAKSFSAAESHGRATDRTAAGFFNGKEI